MTGMREDLERRRHHRQPRRAVTLPPVREWTVGRNGVPWDVGVRLVCTAGPPCSEQHPSALYHCSRRGRHGGRHAAAGSDRRVFAVWEQESAPAEVPC